MFECSIFFSYMSRSNFLVSPYGYIKKISSKERVRKLSLLTGQQHGPRYKQTVMGTTILGVGVGLFIIIAIWTIAILLCIISHRTKKNIGSVTVAIAVLITLALIFIPRESEIPKKVVYKVYDKLFVWRISLVILLGLSSIGGLLVFIVSHLMEPRHAQAIKQWKL
ncbi:hypothetical protein C0J52_20746 [Blattella germanica]|nr:hypothetical protein C0J52_20746 [Blattella germanica]